MQLARRGRINTLMSEHALDQRNGQHLFKQEIQSESCYFCIFSTELIFWQSENGQN